MILAVLGEIHGDFHALSRTLDAIAGEGITTILQAGRLLGPGCETQELVACLRAHEVLALQSPEDRALLHARRKAARLIAKYGKEAYDRLLDLHDRVPSATLEWIATLPRKRSYSFEGVRVLLCHGAPSGQEPPLGPDSSRQRLQREWERDTADIILCGGVPAFDLRFGEVLLAAPGPLATPPGGTWLQVDTESRTCLHRHLLEKHY
jgi:predicted phosphodiesterase